MSLFDRLKNLFRPHASSPPAPDAASSAADPSASDWLPSPMPLHEDSQPGVAIARHADKPQLLKSSQQVFQSFICAVAGVSQKNRDGSDRQALIRRYASPGAVAELRREADNPYDSNAVAVFVRGRQIGYLRAEVAERMARLIDTGDYSPSATIQDVRGGVAGKDTIGVSLDVTIYTAHVPFQHVEMNGVPIWQLLRSHKDDLAVMLKCCGAEEQAFARRGPCSKQAPRPGAFLRVAILSKKRKDIGGEIAICRRWAAMAEQYESAHGDIGPSLKSTIDVTAHANLMRRLAKINLAT